MKNAIINVLLLTATILLFFGSIEVFLRVTKIQTVKPNPPHIYQTSEDERISYELIPDSTEEAYREWVTVNSLGFRSPEIDPQKQTLFVLGDSITFGYGLQDDQTLPAALQRHYPEWNIVNTGVPGYNLSQQIAMYDAKLRALDHNALMIVFHFNDLGSTTGKLDEQGILRPRDWNPDAQEICGAIDRGILGKIPGRCWLNDHSAFYKAFQKLVNMRYNNQVLEQTREQSQKKPASDPVTDEQLTEYELELTAFTNSLNPTIDRVFIIWPDRHLHERSRPLLREIAEDNGFRVIDLYDTFGNEVPVLSWDTVHPSPEAVETAAGVVANEIDFFGIVDKIGC